MRPVIVVAGILDTKGEEVKFLASRIEAAGGTAKVMELSLGTECGWADIGLSDVLREVGMTPEEIFRLQRNDAADTVGAAAAKLMVREYKAERVQGIVALGGSMGTAMGSRIMRALPTGAPKVLLTTASGSFRQIVGTKDLCVMYSISEAGINSITKTIMNNAAAAVVGMANAPKLNAENDRKLIACMMMGLTTPCVKTASALLEDKGDIIINHATGSGGESLEEMISDGYISGVLDITTHELNAALFGGKNDAGEKRLRTAAEMGIPQVIAPGATDYLLYGGKEGVVPQQYIDQLGERGGYWHNPNIYLMGTTLDEAYTLGREMAERVKDAKAPCVICVPTRGFSGTDMAHPDLSCGWSGENTPPFWIEDRENPGHSLRAKRLCDGLRDVLKENHNENVQVLLVDRHINQPQFGELCGELLRAMLEGKWTPAMGCEKDYVKAL